MNKVMIFDLDDTLYDQLSGFEYAYYRHFGDTDIGVERLYRHFRLYSEELFEATQTGALSVPDMHVVRITRAVADFDIELPEEKAHAFQRDYEYAQQHIKLSTTIVEMLQYLVQKKRQIRFIDKWGVRPSACQNKSFRTRSIYSKIQYVCLSGTGLIETRSSHI